MKFSTFLFTLCAAALLGVVAEGKCCCHKGHGGSSNSTMYPCVSNSSAPECADYAYPQVEADLNSCCEMMPYMIGCTIRDDCQEGKMNGSSCSSFSLLQDICLADEGMQQMGCCRNVTRLCGAGSVVKQCRLEPPIQAVVSTFPVMSDVRGACGTDVDSAGCATCVNETASGCPDPLHSLVELCTDGEARNEKACKEWLGMCDATADKEFYSLYCSAEAPPTTVDQKDEESQSKGDGDDGAAQLTSLSGFGVAIVTALIVMTNV